MCSPSFASALRPALCRSRSISNNRTPSSRISRTAKPCAAMRPIVSQLARRSERDRRELTARTRRSSRAKPARRVRLGRGNRMQSSTQTSPRQQMDTPLLLRPLPLPRAVMRGAPAGLLVPLAVAPQQPRARSLATASGRTMMANRRSLRRRSNLATRVIAHRIRHPQRRSATASGSATFSRRSVWRTSRIASP